MLNGHTIYTPMCVEAEGKTHSSIGNALFPRPTCSCFVRVWRSSQVRFVLALSNTLIGRARRSGCAQYRVRGRSLAVSVFLKRGVSLVLLSLNEHDPEAVAHRINENGIDVIENFVSKTALKEAQRSIRESAEKSKMYGDPIDHDAAAKNTFIENWRRAPSFLEFCRSVSCYVHEQIPASPNWRHTLRILTGENCEPNSLLFHYDSYVLTALIPILMPSREETAQLILIPNARPVRRSYLVNVFDKLIVDSPLSQTVLKRRNENNRLKRVPMVPGNLYLFWGYRSIHANDAFDPEEIRCTAILHFCECHHTSKLKQFLSTYR